MTNGVEGKIITEQSNLVELLDRINKAMLALWGPLPLADTMARTPQPAVLSAQLRTQQMAAIPILREAHVILQDVLDEMARQKYNVSRPVTEPKKAK